MRTWLWIILVFVLAVALGLVLREHSGNVLIVAQPWRIELSLTLAVLLLIAGFFVLYVVIRFLAWLVSGPARFRAWRGWRGEKRDHELLESGWLNVLEGRFTQGEKELAKVMGNTRSQPRKVLAGLASARASHYLGEFSRRDEALKFAREQAGTEPRLKDAAATVAAEMYLDQNRPQDALVLLQPLQDASSRYFNATRLLLRAHRQLNNHDRVYDLTRLLLRRGVLDKPQAMPIIETAAAARLRAGGMDAFKAIWSDLRADERTLPDVALAAACVQDTQGNHDEAAKILEAAIAVNADPRLLNAYGRCPPDQVARRLGKAEVWLKSRSEDPDLLAALGNLCLIGQLWGQGEHYLLRSMKIRGDVRIHALLGNLYDRLGRQPDAMKHWRLASGVAGTLPVLATNQALPSADMRSDPAPIDVARAAEPVTPHGVPMAASAVDYLVDADSAESQAVVPVSATQANPADAALDDYFDSAPIPGVDLSQTSDRPSGHSGRR
ncbi:MAG TPA: heme biosynthesis HemY N-terminal domain-containing protein [Burkholderiaceae bacterium]|nr:heme biosynthesis HemY N-terminal domain-containing protein [Burkholderiaceae bacterium]